MGGINHKCLNGSEFEVVNVIHSITFFPLTVHFFESLGWLQ